MNAAASFFVLDSNGLSPAMNVAASIFLARFQQPQRARPASFVLDSNSLSPAMNVAASIFLARFQ
jgi:hypothetical protein